MTTYRSKEAIPPHPVLSNHYGTREQRLGSIRHLFDASASSYDRINDWMSLRTGERDRLDALRRIGVEERQSVLDIAIAPSIPMLREAAKCGGSMRAAGTAKQVPLPDRSVGSIQLSIMNEYTAPRR